jgi:hypothetical protein
MLDEVADRSVSRRRLVLGGAIILGGTGVATLATRDAAAAGGKVSQAQANYRDTPRGALRCDKCLQFQPPSGCKVVDGVISPSGSCNFFAARPR